MSGHSKWATIKRKKAATDAKRGKMFTRALREIQVAAKLGGANPDGNPRLKSAIQAAKSVSVPNDNIDRAIKRGAGASEGADFEEILYEGYGPGGVAMLIKVLTDNKLRTVSDIRYALMKYGGSLAGSNSVAYLFSEKGVFLVPKAAASEEQIIESGLDAGVEEVLDGGDTWEVLCELSAFSDVRRALEKLCPELEGAPRYIPSTTVRVGGDSAQSLLKLLDALDDMDDVQNVVANFEMDDNELEGLG